MSDNPRERVLALMARRDAMEAEQDALKESLATRGVGMAAPLVDEQGFPRADIDIPSVRADRVRVIRLENDLRALLEEIQQALAEALAPSEVPSAAPRNGTNGTSATAAPVSVVTPNGHTEPAPTAQEVAQDRPFAYVNAMAPNSQAQRAGVQRFDQIISFGTVTAQTSSPLQALPGQLQQGPVQIVVLRDGVRHTLSVSGPPLGCQVLPLGN